MEEGLVFRRHKAWLESGCNSIKPNKNFGGEKLSLYDENLADLLISKYDYLDSCISNENFDSSLNNNLVLLLKFILENGPYLDNDVNYKEQIDMFFSLFRNLLRNYLKNLPESVSLLILRLIEIRACKWNIKPSIEEYYMSKIDKSNKPSSSFNQYRSNEDANDGAHLPNCLRTSKSFGDILTNYSCDDFSTRNLKQLKLNNKNMIKDEVVIKNSDSGKVMGIKGRRVHMIEEMSDTIISFQKANPGAKDRLVQITGQCKENIDKAKSLIDVTIKQNTSPIPFIDCMDSTVDSQYQPGEDTFSNIQSNEISTLPLDQIEKYLIKLRVANEETIIEVSNPIIGKNLEKFLEQYNFSDFSLSISNQLWDVNANGDQGGSVNKHTITYDREFLLQLREGCSTSSHIIDDIMKKGKSFFRP